jgi:hypothetical protein
MTGKSSSMAVMCLKAINNKHLGLPDLHPLLIICGGSTVDSPRIILWPDKHEFRVYYIYDIFMIRHKRKKMMLASWLIIHANKKTGKDENDTRYHFWHLNNLQVWITSVFASSSILR